MQISPRFSTPGINPLDAAEYDKRRSVITNPDGTIVFEARDAEIPKGWSQLATDIVVSKYFRRAGLNTPEGRETSVRQVVYRIAHALRDAGERMGGYFDSPEDANTFQAELEHILVHQIAAFNSPVWFNCGLSHEYGIKGSGGNFAWDFDAQKPFEVENNYERPQCSACFIQSVDDDLMSIFELVRTEARIFKYGSGTGTNFSRLRSSHEKLSGGGTSSGLMSFLEVLDRGAGATKSGGTTRRAAKMVCLDMDHPEIETFINWKVREEEKARILIEFGGLPADFNGEAYRTVAGQNSNNSVRVTDEFMQAALEDKPWYTRARTTGEVVKQLPAKDLLDQISKAAWRCADPGVQFDTSINDWHTCPATDKIRASNPCVTGETLVATDAGWQRIDSLVGKSARIIGADGQPHFVTSIFPTGTKPTFRLRTRAGYEVRITGDHRVLTQERGDVAVNDLKIGEHLMLQGARFGRRALSERLATAIGLAVGDGCLSTCMTKSGEEEILTLVMAASEAAVLASVATELNSQKAALRATGTSGNPSAVSVSLATGGGSVSRLAFASRPVVKLFKEFAVLGEGSKAKRFTPAVFTLDRPAMAGVLRGLFTADGTVANYGEKSQYVALDSTSSELLAQVQTLLLSFGIKSKLYGNRRGDATESILPDGKGGTKVYPVEQMHSLRISRSSRVIFEREIGFDPASPKAATLAQLNEEVAAYADTMTDRVASIEPLADADVFDLTEEATHHFVANGLVVHNCSEYMFLDDSACNLSSINLIKFLDDEGNFDVAAYRHTVRLLILAQEIAVDYSSYPTEKIARNSHDYRPLGLGYANLGAMLMVLGIPYDSPEGTAMCGALTALMTGHAYAVSAEIAATKGAFPGHARNAKPFMRVMRKHREACERISAEFCPSYLLAAARQAWDEAIDLGEKHGYRNAQATVLAPTGTIGLLMDCDTTGIEPDFALVKFKKLAGGGYFKIINQSVPQALRRLGYSSREIQEILQYVNGTMTLRGAPHVNDQTLKAHGLTDEDLARIETGLRGCLDLNSMFNIYTLGDEALGRLGLTAEQTAGQGILRTLGFTDAQIYEANDHICGVLTIEGAPHLRPEHLAVFDCANRCGRNGQRFIAPMGHVRMMAAAQPFISGAISKTVNLPNEATVADIQDTYVQAWQMGLKAIALYRDGCKMSQPLSTSHAKKKEAPAEATAEAVAEALPAPAAAAAASPAQTFNAALAAAETSAATVPTVRLKAPAPIRRRLPVRRNGLTIESRIATHKVFLRTGEYEDGALGEIFIDMHKEGAAFRSMMNCFAIAISKGLQYGVPLKEFVDTFTFTRFEPQGMCDHPNIKMVTSIIDYVFRVLALEYLGQTEYCQIKPETNPAFEAAGAAGASLLGTVSPAAPPASPGTRASRPQNPADLASAQASTSNAAPAAHGALSTELSSAVLDEASEEIEEHIVTTESAREAHALEDSMTYSAAQPTARQQNRVAAPAPGGIRPRTAKVEEIAPSARVATMEGGATPGATGLTTHSILSASHQSPSPASARPNAPAGSQGLKSQMEALMGDAPFCDVCGHITVRNGTCYKCLNCGNSMGCS